MEENWIEEILVLIHIFSAKIYNICWLDEFLNFIFSRSTSLYWDMMRYDGIYITGFISKERLDPLKVCDLWQKSLLRFRKYALNHPQHPWSGSKQKHGIYIGLLRTKIFYLYLLLDVYLQNWKSLSLGCIHLNKLLTLYQSWLIIKILILINHYFF